MGVSALLRGTAGVWTWRRIWDIRRIQPSFLGKEFRRNVREANPDALILAEHYGEASSWLQGDEWDSVMNYDAFMEPVSWFLTGMEKHSDSFRQDLLGNKRQLL